MPKNVLTVATVNTMFKPKIAPVLEISGNLTALSLVLVRSANKLSEPTVNKKKMSNST